MRNERFKNFLAAMGVMALVGLLIAASQPMIGTKQVIPSASGKGTNLSLYAITTFNGLSNRYASGFFSEYDADAILFHTPYDRNLFDWQGLKAIRYGAGGTPLRALYQDDGSTIALYWNKGIRMPAGVTNESTSAGAVAVVWKIASGATTNVWECYSNGVLIAWMGSNGVLNVPAINVTGLVTAGGFAGTGPNSVTLTNSSGFTFFSLTNDFLLFTNSSGTRVQMTNGAVTASAFANDVNVVLLSTNANTLGVSNVLITPAFNLVDMTTTNSLTWTNFSGFGPGRTPGGTIVFRVTPTGINRTNLWPTFNTPYSGVLAGTNDNSTMWATFTNGNTYYVTVNYWGTNLTMTCARFSN